MRIVAHLSDLHFGRVDYRLLGSLLETIRELKPDLVAVSGDLTQRLRTHEFREARAFLDRLPRPVLVVPGNHDVPLHNPYGRFVGRLTRFRAYITDDLEPFFADSEMAVAGVNTARSLTFKNGRINQVQVDRLLERFCGLAPDVVRVVVTHHPFDLPEHHGAGELVGRARMAIEQLARCAVDVYLAGHIHIGSAHRTAARYRIHGYSALVVLAGTATSSRGRGECNSFNVLRIAYPHVTVERIAWDPGRKQFAVADRSLFELNRPEHPI